MDSINVFTLIQRLEEIEKQLPDDQWDEHHWKGFKAGIINAISIIFKKELNYNLTSQEIRKIVIERGIHEPI